MQVLCVRWDSQPSRSHSVLFLLCYQIFTFNVFIHANEIFCTRRVDLILSLACYRLFSLSVWSHLNLTSGLLLYYKNSKCHQTPQKDRHLPFPLGKKTNSLHSTQNSLSLRCRSHSSARRRPGVALIFPHCGGTVVSEGCVGSYRFLLLLCMFCFFGVYTSLSHL